MKRKINTSLARVLLKLRIVVHDDGDDADIWQETPGPSHNVPSLQPQLARCVQATVVNAVVVSFGQELEKISVMIQVAKNSTL